MGKDHKPALIVLTDRKYRTTNLIKITTKNASVIADKIIKKMKSEKDQIHTMTFDNGLEFAKHEKIAKVLGIKTYFTRPYTSQDKGTVENRIGVIRRFIPKGTDTIHDVAVCMSNSGNQVVQVGSKKPNELGLFDMSGNVWELCSDFIRKKYSYNPNKVNLTFNAMRGGSYSVFRCQVSSKLPLIDLNKQYSDVGFRLVYD